MRSAQRGTGTKTALGAGLLLGATLLAAGCRSRPIVASGTELGTADVLHGRLVGQHPTQAFTFEGVESSLLDFDLVSDRGDMAAPAARLYDPEGKEIDLAAATRTAQGAATVAVRDVVLLRSGTYQVQVTPTVPGPVYYRFDYGLRFPPVRDMRVDLKANDPYPLSVAAPRGGQVTVQITPLQGSTTLVRVDGVEDPWGGRALDPTQRLPNAPPPMIHHGDDGSYYLNFNAPIPGRYTILAAARPGHDGPALVRVDVRAPRSAAREVMHPNHPPVGYGVPASTMVSGSASDAR